MLALSCLCPAHAQERAALSSGRDALPGVYEVPLVVRAPAGLVGRAGLSYGWTEAVLHDHDQHHRAELDAAASITPLPWLSSYLRLLGRYDRHTAQQSSSDDGVVTQTFLGSRVSLPLSASFSAGAELGLWLPGGASVGKALTALSGDLQLLLAYAPPTWPVRVGLALGVRLDRSRYAGGHPEQLSAADRLGLGASDGLWATRSGLAITYRTGALEWLAEWALRRYFAYASRSPQWFRVGARYHPSAQLQLELLLGISPSRRPAITQGAPLAVVEPRLWAGLALTYAWRTEPPPPPKAAVAAEPALPEPAPQPEPPAQLHGQVLAPGGGGLPDATVALSGPAGNSLTTTDERGQFDLVDVPAGDYELRVTATGFKPAERALMVQGGSAPALSIALTRELPIGLIRGTVRRFDGKPVVATIAIAELNIQRPSRADGSFEIEVPPGDYSVTVSAEGFRSQQRTAHVELRGVAIVISELEPKR